MTSFPTSPLCTSSSPSSTGRPTSTRSTQILRTFLKARPFDNTEKLFFTCKRALAFWMVCNKNVWNWPLRTNTMTSLNRAHDLYRRPSTIFKRPYPPEASKSIWRRRGWVVNLTNSLISYWEQTDVEIKKQLMDM